MKYLKSFSALFLFFGTIVAICSYPPVLLTLCGILIFVCLFGMLILVAEMFEPTKPTKPTKKVLLEEAQGLISSDEFYQERLSWAKTYIKEHKEV